MPSKFDLFVVLAEMRTGSNFLEANLNALDGVTCHGEAFNPFFIGYPNVDNVLGVSQQQREVDPTVLIDRVRGAEGLNGFRYFHDHDPRVIDGLLADPRCAKIVLTRNPVESYVSWKIAQATGQWKLTDAKNRRDGQAVFDGDEFISHIETLQAFQKQVLRALQTTGQTAFYVAYEDLQDLDVMNGLAAFLGVEARLPELDKKLKKQNPEPLSEKVANFEEMEGALARLDRFDLTRTPNFEPRRNAMVPNYIAAAEAPVMYLPLRAGVEDAICGWLGALDGVGADALQRDFTQKPLRKWKRVNRGHRAFTVVTHPLTRAHRVFCERILSSGPGSFGEIREVLRKRYKLPLPKNGPGESYDVAAHRAAFLAFLEWLKGNLAGQTSVRVDPGWASQSQMIQGFAEFNLPDLIIREEQLEMGLGQLCDQLGRKAPAVPEVHEPECPVSLADIYDADIENACKEAYTRDYMMLGYGPWKKRYQAA
ncbi:nodulation protein NodH [Donghicola sp. C2-DW-16]|uniref:Nodulation protein NodH n=1 Tax=Donghicola mangrovi TaxID=2729614 RepID=A0ABX2PAX2_9RHOB|nr:nodulation protein NodH [Donghicola mangrovi]NVO26189.1 nodulation protein NodH [Donghicola mangrovi]